MPNNKPGCLGIILQMFGLMPKNIESAELPYGLRDDFLSSAELSFYKVLSQALQGRAVICPKVSLAEIFFVKRPNENMAYRNKIDRKHVDFLLCSIDTLNPIAGVELDDMSHQRPDRVERDGFVDDVFKIARLPLIRVINKSSYTLEEIRDKVEFLFDTSCGVVNKMEEPSDLDGRNVPVCPKCGIPMVLRTARRGENAGSSFYGCTNYPKCKETVRL